MLSLQIVIVQKFHAKCFETQISKFSNNLKQLNKSCSLSIEYLHMSLTLSLTAVGVATTLSVTQNGVDINEHS